MVSLINKQLLLTAYAYLYITEQQEVQQGSEALQLQMNTTQQEAEEKKAEEAAEAKALATKKPAELFDIKLASAKLTQDELKNRLQCVKQDLERLTKEIEDNGAKTPEAQSHAMRLQEGQDGVNYHLGLQTALELGLEEKALLERELKLRANKSPPNKSPHKSQSIQQQQAAELLADFESIKTKPGRVRGWLTKAEELETISDNQIRSLIASLDSSAQRDIVIQEIQQEAVELGTFARRLKGTFPAELDAFIDEKIVEEGFAIEAYRKRTLDQAADNLKKQFPEHGGLIDRVFVIQAIQQEKWDLVKKTTSLKSTFPDLHTLIDEQTDNRNHGVTELYERRQRMFDELKRCKVEDSIRHSHTREWAAAKSIADRLEVLDTMKWDYVNAINTGK